jgi:hypothetical protein
MVLLVMIALAMLSLSTIELRSSQNGRAMAEAQANARMALMIAMGELQKEMGPDQRISANADILSLDASGTVVSVANPHYMGVWDSWIAGTVDPATVNPDYPSGASHHQTIGDGTAADDSMLLEMHPDYAQKDKHFRKWLVSLPPEDQENILAFNSAFPDSSTSPTASSDAVRLVGEGSLGTSSAAEDFVNVSLVDIKSENDQLTGRYGWWVGDESQKARLMPDSYQNGTLTAADKIFRSQSPASMGNKAVPGLESITDEEELDKLPSHKTLDLVGLDTPPAVGAPTVSQLNFHNSTIYSNGVLADVRQGGLKRDLSTLLDQEINLADTGDEFMLYKFGADGEDSVPIQDLSAYYQLYNKTPAWAGTGTLGGVEHNDPPVDSRAMQVTVPYYGENRYYNKRSRKDVRDTFTRQYTSLYRNPVPVKVQFVVGVGATDITQADRDYLAAARRPKILRASDKYKLLLGVKPVITLWNPSNLPMVMGTDASQVMYVSFPPFVLRWKKYRAAGSPDEYENSYLNLNYAISNEPTGDGRARSLGPYIMKVQFARNTPIVFQPGEVKMFSVPINATNFLESGGRSVVGNISYQAEEFLPDGFFVTPKSAVPSGIDVVGFPGGNRSIYMVFGDDDRFDFQVLGEAASPRSRAVSVCNEIKGSGFHFSMIGAGLGAKGTYSPTSHFRNYQFISRFGVGANTPWDFNNKLMMSGFPNGADIDYEGKIQAMQGSDILAATANGEAKALLNFFMMAGCETSEASSGGAGAGRRTTARPFLHGSTLSAPIISGREKKNLYDYSWEWQVNKINSLAEAFHEDGNSRGFYGGGFTTENGVTHVVQQYLPALPPISIASLSSARLGGFSLANNAVAASPTENIIIGNGMSTDPVRLRTRNGIMDFRQVTATGQGGLAPHTLQAIGNAYAHPNIPADQAFTRYLQRLNMNRDATDPPERTYADHSYLVNKALWDDYFFSSISPQLSTTPLYGGSSSKTALEVANDFFFEDLLLPNRRMIPYTANLNSGSFATLSGQYDDFSNGFADKITSHMMVAGPFNVNSTSVDAWKVFFSSLKGKPLSFLQNQASSLATTVSDDTPVAPGMLPNGEAISSRDLSADANDPIDQWTSSRSMTDVEIDALAKAMVRQVKLRGPFLSLSEFVNRRLDASNTDFAVKGALQTALDDPSVTINEAFRNGVRGGLDTEAATFVAEFPKALEGPIAYGSTPYVDQADVLRHSGSILTPRGDTFVIRTYGDSLDTKGNVVARARCEAVIQRTPEYADSSDEPYKKQSGLTSETNKTFGRQLKIISFRWLNADEV